MSRDTGLEPQTSRAQTGLLLTCLSLALDSGSARARRRWPHCRSTRCGYCSRRHGTGAWYATQGSNPGPIWHWAMGIGQWALGNGHWLLGIRHLAFGIWHWSATHAFGPRLGQGELAAHCAARLGAPGAMDEGAAALSWLLEEMERELPTPPVQRSLLAELWRFLMHKHATLCRRLAPLPNAQCPMPNAQCPMPNAMPNNQCPMPNAQCPMPNAQCHISHCHINMGALQRLVGAAFGPITCPSVS